VEKRHSQADYLQSYVNEKSAMNPDKVDSESMPFYEPSDYGSYVHVHALLQEWWARTQASARRSKWEEEEQVLG